MGDDKGRNELSADTPQMKSAIDNLRKVIGKADSDKLTEQQRSEVQQALNQYPELASQMADVSRLVRLRILKRLHNGESGRLAADHLAKQIATNLGYEGASQIERLLIDNVVLQWTRWQAIEWRYQVSIYEESVTLSLAEHWERRLSLTQARYLKALESLARVRWLLSRAPVQINIAQQQIVQNK